MAFDNRTIHLCVDMQRLFTEDGPWPTPWMERIAPIVIELAERFRRQTIFTRFIPPQRAEHMPGRWQHYYERWKEVTRDCVDPRLLDLIPGLDCLSPPAATVDKPVYSPFVGGRLDALLKQRGIETIVVTGAETDVCVLATILGAVDRGYHVVLVTDAVCSSSDTGHEALLTLFRNRFSLQVDTATSEDVVAHWRPAA